MASVEFTFKYEDVKSIKYSSEGGKLEIPYRDGVLSLKNVTKEEYERILKEWKKGRKFLAITYNQGD
jgi:hypothetical protein